MAIFFIESVPAFLNHTTSVAGERLSHSMKGEIKTFRRGDAAPLPEFMGKSIQLTLLIRYNSA